MSESQNNGVFAPAPRQRLTTGAFKCACAAVTAAIVLAGCEKPAPVVVQTPAPPQVVVAPPSAQGQVEDAKDAANKAAAPKN